MLIYFLSIVKCIELSEKGYLYSIGEKKFLSLDTDHIRLVAKHQMPQPFEIEERKGDESWKLKLMPSPRQDDKVIDKDWWTNDHRLILHKATDWQSEKFTFALLPKNMIKIVVKEKCIVPEDSGYVKAVTCDDTDKQLFRWIPNNEKSVVEEFVERHGGVIDYRRDYDKNNRPNYDDNYGLYYPQKVRPTYSNRQDADSDFIPPPKRPRSTGYSSSNRPSRRSYDEDCDFVPPRRRLGDVDGLDFSGRNYPNGGSRNYPYNSNNIPYYGNDNNSYYNRNKFNEYSRNDPYYGGNTTPYYNGSRFNNDYGNNPYYGSNYLNVNSNYPNNQNIRPFPPGAIMPLDCSETYPRPGKNFLRPYNNKSMYPQRPFRENSQKFVDGKSSENLYYRYFGNKSYDSNDSDYCENCEPGENFYAPGRQNVYPSDDNYSCTNTADHIEKVICDINNLNFGM